MSSYVVLARKWRPSQFADLVGQAPVVRTLMNAIQSTRIHHAYLLTGSRGVGKTSIARIFAKAVRCQATEIKNLDGTSWIQTCDRCSSCKEITSSISVDVIEIDGASNNGVDAIREVRENVKFLPFSGTKKIYIIDEVHMLTTAAFNALLKTLEEPPSHIIFVLATTEPHKIPATILSRCQRFDLKRVTLAHIQNRLKEISLAENIAIEPTALTIIAKASDGSMRDALSLLDQVIGYSGNNITAQNTRESIGLVSQEILIQIARAVLSRDATTALHQVEASYVHGFDLKELTKGLVEIIHLILLAKVGITVNSELSAEEFQIIKSLSELRSVEELELIFQVLHHGIETLTKASQPKIILDILVIKCALAEGFADTESSDTVSNMPAPVRDQGKLPSLPPSLKPAAQPTPAVQAKSYDSLIEQVKITRPLLGSILENGFCKQLPTPANDETLIISFSIDNSYFKDQLGSKAYQEQLAQFTKTYFGKGIRIQIVLAQTHIQHPESVAARKDREISEKSDAIKTEARNHPLIKEAVALFGADLGSVEILTNPSERSDADTA